MQPLSNKTGSNSDSIVSGENSGFKVASGWESNSHRTENKKQKIIQLANKKIPLDLVFKKYSIELEQVYSSTGWTLRCSCPFDDHNDRTPSFGYNPNDNVFNCFGCHRGGGPVEFVVYKEDRPKLEIAKELLRLFGISDFQLEELENFDYEGLQRILFKFADHVREFKALHNLDQKALAYSKAVNWNLDVYLRQHTANNTIILTNLEARINKLIEQLKAFGEAT